MSDSTPLIFKRKSKPTARARASSPEPDTNDSGIESPSTLASRLKNKAKRAKPKSRLSFGADEDEVCVPIAPKNIVLIVGRRGLGSYSR
jgi:GC-rich sequence DNA-binding factor